MFVPGLTKGITSINLLNADGKKKLNYTTDGKWLEINIPSVASDPLVSVIEVVMQETPVIDKMLGVDPAMETILPVDFAEVEGCHKTGKSWMEKFGEWKHVVQVGQWNDQSKLTYAIDIVKPGYYQVDLNYTGQGRVVWKIENSAGEIVQNQQAAASVYNWYPWGWMKFKAAGRYNVTVSFLEGDGDKVSLSALRFKPVE